MALVDISWLKAKPAKIFTCFSIPNYVIKKERLRGAQHGKTEAQKQHFLAHNARKRCITKNFDGIHDRFQRDSENRVSQLKVGWTKEKCIEMGKLAQEDHWSTTFLSQVERVVCCGHLDTNFLVQLSGTHEIETIGPLVILATWPGLLAGSL